MTRGGLTKNDLMLSKSGRIVSKKKSEAAKVAYTQFGFRKREDEVEKKTRKRRKKKIIKD
jgi:hypothetical protein